jgi:hypothetical protein
MEATERLLLASTDDELTGGGPRGLARRLVALRVILAVVGTMADEVERTLAEAMPADEVVVPGVGVARRSPRVAESWDLDAVRHDARSTVTARAALDRSTGEVDPVARGVAESTWDAAARVFSFGKPKTAFAKELGYRVDEYRTTTPVGWKVVIDPVTVLS